MYRFSSLRQKPYGESTSITVGRIFDIFSQKNSNMKKIHQSLTISITVIFNLLVCSAARAESFENLLQTSLTSAEEEIHNIIGEDKALEVGRNVCSSLKTGSSIEEFSAEVAISLLQLGLTQEQLQTAALYTGKVIAASVTSFCPEYTSKLQELKLLTQ